MKKKFLKLEFLIILFISTLMCFNFFKPHYSMDTYFILHSGYTCYATTTVLPLGRPLSAFFLYFCDYLNLEVDTVVVCSSIISAVFMSLSAYIIFKNFIKYFNNNLFNKTIIIVLSILSIFNFCTNDYLFYIESCVLGFGVLCAILGATIFVSNLKYKYIYSAILAILATISYQSILPIYVILIFIYMFFNNLDLKEKIKPTIICLLHFVIALLFNYIILKISINILSLAEYKIASIIDIIKNAFNAITFFSKDIFIHDHFKYHIYFYIFIFVFICILMFLYNIKKRTLTKHIFIYITLFIISYLFTLSILITLDSFYSATRMFIGIPFSISILVIYALYILRNYKLPRILISLCILITFIYNFFFLTMSSKAMLEVNNKDKEIAYYVLNKIYKYEEKTNTTVTDIYIFKDADPTYDYYDIYLSPYSNISHKMISEECVTVSILCHYSNNKELYRFYAENSDDYETIYESYFKNKSWDSFSDEQLVFVDNSLYWCMY